MITALQICLTNSLATHQLTHMYSNMKLTFTTLPMNTAYFTLTKYTSINVTISSRKLEKKLHLALSITHKWTEVYEVASVHSHIDYFQFNSDQIFCPFRNLMIVLRCSLKTKGRGTKVLRLNFS